MTGAMVTRRAALIGAGAVVGAALAPRRAWASRPDYKLVAAPGEAGLVVPDGPATKAWLYNGQSPGPELRARQGDMLVVEVENQLPEPTTVHWHGLRVPVGMDGMPWISQPPIKPGERFTYRLPLLDAGTFWYHPHVSSSEQVGRGLQGLLIVEEPPEAAALLGADREIAWALDDWRLDQDAQIAEFGSRRDMSHAGRVGNVLTVNGTYLTNTELRAGERVRLRIGNVSNAQSYRLRFDPFDPWVVALDGHPIAPIKLGDGGLWLGSGQRADVVFDVTLRPGETAKLIDDAYGDRGAYEVMTWRVSDAAPLREAPLAPPQALPANPIPRPELASATRHEVVFEGGAPRGVDRARMDGAWLDARALAEAGKFWAMNGVVPTELYTSEPMLRFELGATHVLRLVNETRWRHPIHLHGHSFHILRQGAEDPLAGAPVRDTVLLQPGEAAEVAFVADNPGKWMLHCHVLEHQMSGMMGVVEVAG